MALGGSEGISMEETLFGVEKGLLLSTRWWWTQDRNGTQQDLTISFGWENRTPTTIAMFIPDDQQIAHYVALFMPIIMNGAWLHKVRLSHMIVDAIEKAKADGAEVLVTGTKVRKL